MAFYDDNTMNEWMNFITMLQRVTIRYMYTYTMQCNVIKTLHKMSDKMQLYLKRQIKCYGQLLAKNGIKRFCKFLSLHSS